MTEEKTDRPQSDIDVIRSLLKQLEEAAAQAAASQDAATAVKRASLPQLLKHAETPQHETQVPGPSGSAEAMPDRQPSPRNELATLKRVPTSNDAVAKWRPPEFPAVVAAQLPALQSSDYRRKVLTYGSIAATAAAGVTTALIFSKVIEAASLVSFASQTRASLVALLGSEQVAPATSVPVKTTANPMVKSPPKPHDEGQSIARISSPSAAEPAEKPRTIKQAAAEKSIREPTAPPPTDRVPAIAAMTGHGGVAKTADAAGKTVLAQSPEPQPQPLKMTDAMNPAPKDIGDLLHAASMLPPIVMPKTPPSFVFESQRSTSPLSFDAASLTSLSLPLAAPMIDVSMDGANDQSTAGRLDPVPAAPQSPEIGMARLTAENTHFTFEAGQPVALRLAIERQDAAKNCLLVARGVPKGARLSNGAPIGKAAWFMPATRLRDLSLTSPKGQSTPFSIKFELVTLEGRIYPYSKPVSSRRIEARRIEASGLVFFCEQPCRWKQARPNLAIA